MKKKEEIWKCQTSWDRLCHSVLSCPVLYCEKKNWKNNRYNKSHSSWSTILWKLNCPTHIFSSGILDRGIFFKRAFSQFTEHERQVKLTNLFNANDVHTILYSWNWNWKSNTFCLWPFKNGPRVRSVGYFEIIQDPDIWNNHPRKLSTFASVLWLSFSNFSGSLGSIDPSCEQPRLSSFNHSHLFKGTKCIMKKKEIVSDNLVSTVYQKIIPNQTLFAWKKPTNERTNEDNFLRGIFFSLFCRGQSSSNTFQGKQVCSNFTFKVAEKVLFLKLMEIVFFFCKFSHIWRKRWGTHDKITIAKLFASLSPLRKDVHHVLI